MSDTKGKDELRFAPLLLKAYLIGTLVAAIALHIAISLIAPGDGGTLLALNSGLFPIILMLVAAVAFVAFPIAALLSWPFRRLVVANPVIAFVLATGVGLLAGAVLTKTEFQIGPGDFWSGALVGFVFSSTWFWIVLRAGRSGARRLD